MRYNSEKQIYNQKLNSLVSDSNITYKYGGYYLDDIKLILDIDSYIGKLYNKSTGKLINSETLNQLKLNIRINSNTTLYDFDKHSYRYYMKIVQKTQNTKELRELQSRYNNYLESIQNLNKPKACIYITGESGTGKTTLAKMMAQKKYSKDDIFISSGGNHPFDEYYGEKVIIIDDFRSSIMPYNDLLRLLDPYTNSNVGARYKNKNLARCELIILTSVLTPVNLYTNINEERYQLYRRIQTFEIQNLDFVGIYLTKMVYNKDKDEFYEDESVDITEKLEQFKSQNKEENDLKIDDLI